MTTRTQAQITMQHVLEVVLHMPPDSPPHKALAHNGYVKPQDFIMEPDETLDQLQYPDDTGALITLVKGHAGKLKIFKQFVQHYSNQGNPIGTNNWISLTMSEFDDFWAVFANTSIPNILSMAPPPPCPAPPTDIVKEFRQGIK